MSWGKGINRKPPLSLSIEIQLTCRFTFTFLAILEF